MRIGYLECFSGISGDMFLGALVDAGVPFSHLEQVVAALNVGARLESRKVLRGGIAATKVDVLVVDVLSGDVLAGSDAAPQTGSAQAAHSHTEHTHSHHDHPHADHHHANHDDTHGHTHERPMHEAEASSSSHSHAGHSHAEHRSLSAILAIINAAPLTEAVKARSIRAFELLGHAEAAIHSVPVETVHFHEVGAVDTIVDIVCGAAAADLLHIDRWISSPLNVGSGTVVCAHGTLPVPAPATLALLGDAPVYAAGPPMERVTPTGASVLRMLDVSYASLPAMRVQASGYGAGGRDTPGEPNLLRLLIGESDAQAAAPHAGSARPIANLETVAIVETVIDDSSPQLIGYVSDLLLAAGAWDVYRVAVQMKKGRTGVQLTVLCEPDLVPAMRDLILRETTTIGLHWRIENKVAMHREMVTVQTAWGDVPIKVARWPSGKVSNASPEYEDCRLIAARHALPLKHVLQEVIRIYAAQTAQD
jgi:uncharacterized protein (TIGR00299 family) protein